MVRNETLTIPQSRIRILTSPKNAEEPSVLIIYPDSSKGSMGLGSACPEGDKVPNFKVLLEL